MDIEQIYNTKSIFHKYVIQFITIKMLSCILFVLSLTLFSVYGIYKPDEVTNLPGLKDKLNFKHYSGYLNVSLGQIHYYFIQAVKDTKDTPLLIWLNGGPGCSSMDGLFDENGPFLLPILGENYTLIRNPNSWNNVSLPCFKRIFNKLNLFSLPMCYIWTVR